MEMAIILHCHISDPIRPSRVYIFVNLLSSFLLRHCIFKIHILGQDSSLCVNIYTALEVQSLIFINIVIVIISF